MTLQSATLTRLRIALANPTVNFRDSQREAVFQMVNQRGQVLCVQRTGWAKSMVYFVSAKLMREQGAWPTLIISPMLALMGNFLTRERTSPRFECWSLSKSHFLRRTRNLQPKLKHSLAKRGYGRGHDSRLFYGRIHTNQ